MQKSSYRIKKLGIFLAFIITLTSLVSCKQENVITKNEAEVLSLREAATPSLASPEVSARAAIGIEMSRGEIFYSKNIDCRLPMASTTKIMTAIVAIENGDMSDSVKIDKRAVGIEGSSIYLYEGEILTLSDLLYATLLSSANDAATAVAIHIGGDIDSFVAMMNEKAVKLGLSDTHFDNPHGLDSENHYTTARELGIITSHAMKNPKFREIVSTYKTTVPMQNGEGTRLLINHNKLLRNYDGTIGVKTGYTKKSGRCLVSASSRDGVELICVTLSAPSDWQDHEAILDFGNSIYERKTLIFRGDSPISIPVINGVLNNASLFAMNEVNVTVRRGVEIETVIEAPRFVFAPLSSNQKIGEIIFIQDGKIIATAPLITQTDVAKLNKRAILGQ